MAHPTINRQSNGKGVRVNHSNDNGNIYEFKKWSDQNLGLEDYLIFEFIEDRGELFVKLNGEFSLDMLETIVNEMKKL